MTRRVLKLGGLLPALVVAAMLAPGLTTAADASGTWWQLEAIARPTHLAAGQTNIITVTANNLGPNNVNWASSPVTVEATLPPGLHATKIEGAAGKLAARGEATCELATLSCVFESASGLGPYEQLHVAIEVEVENGASGLETVAAHIEGGETPAVSASSQVAVGAAPAGFGFERFDFAAEGPEGEPETQAGAHPFQVTTTLGLNTVARAGKVTSAGLARNLGFTLPPGFIGNPTAVAQCSEADFLTFVAALVNLCPSGAAVGVVSVAVREPFFISEEPETITVPLYNLTPAIGEPARLGFSLFNVPVTLDTEVGPGPTNDIVVHANDVTQTAAFVGSKVTIWGVPGDPRHNAARGWECVAQQEWALAAEIEACPTTTHPATKSFLTLPTACDGPNYASVSGISWPTREAPGGVDAGTRNAETPLTMSGCEKLPFQTTVKVVPESLAAAAPTGLGVDVEVPQATTSASGGLAEADVKELTLKLPDGMVLNPSAASGLSGCSFSPEPARPQGEIALDLVEPATCTQSSAVGTVSIKTPLLGEELVGHVYVGAQEANPFGSLVAAYLVAEAPGAGVTIKLAGEVQLDPVTGALTTRFPGTPPLPFETVHVQLFGGERGVLGNPRSCGSYSATASMSTWAGKAYGVNAAAFNIGPPQGASSCTPSVPFAPSGTMGSTPAGAKSFTQFALQVKREDRSQELNRVTTQLPPGLLADIASVTPCGEPAAREGLCPESSLVGHTTVQAGFGPTPITIAGGRVYLTEPYEGGSYGLSIAQPAKAGPYDLGSGRCDCIVVRAKIAVDPYSARITVSTDRLPLVVRGVRLEVRSITTTIDRSRFAINPTNCTSLPQTIALEGAEGASATLSTHFEAVGCSRLSFTPKFAATTSAHTSRLNGASFRAVVRATSAEANIAKVKVNLPRALPSRLSTLQKACLAAVFNANPHGCPAVSYVGTARVVTPILKTPLTGQAVLVSHGSAKLPDLNIVLEGDNLQLVLVGNTTIHHGITSSAFKAVPDAPISRFELDLPAGPHSALGAFGNFCKKVLKMPTEITGQNGAVIKRTTKVAVTGCRKARHRSK